MFLLKSQICDVFLGGYHVPSTLAVSLIACQSTTHVAQGVLETTKNVNLE